MRILSKLLVATIVSFCFQPVLFSQQQIGKERIVFPAGDVSTPFTWRGDSMFARWEPYSALLIPVKLAGSPHTFYMQFDLGSPYTMLYKNTMAGIAKKYPQTGQNTLAKDTLTDFSLSVGNTSIVASRLPLRPFGNENINWNDTLAPVIIGTLGTDLVDGRSFRIDFPKQEIRIGLQTDPPAAEAFEMYDLVYVYGRILLPAMISGKNTMLFFDSGASAFSLLTDKPTALQLAADNTVPVTHKSSSWGGQWNVYTWPSAANVKIAGRDLPLQQVSYVESGYSSQQAEQMKKMGIGGVTGNKLFIHSVLLVDLRNKKFGISK